MHSDNKNVIMKKKKINKEEMTEDIVSKIKISNSSHVLSNGKTVHYVAEKIVGNGSFGVVFQATVKETGEIVAIKKTLQDKRFKNRELQIMRHLKHDNIVTLRHCFYCNGENPDELYLNLVLEYIPDTLFSVAKNYYDKNKKTLPLLYIKMYIYQTCLSLNYIHGLKICHRDIKPQNLLVDPDKFIVKLCDFGSAKILQQNEPNVSYICSRYYRAPELIFGATNYTTAIDIWSLGCVFAELLLGRPLFPGKTGVDQLVEIIKILGTPTKEEILVMNSNYAEFQFPQINARPWDKIFLSSNIENNETDNNKEKSSNCKDHIISTEAIDLLTKMLAYNPQKRIKPLKAAAHPFFDELRKPDFSLPNNVKIPELFNFSIEDLAKEELHIREILVPKHKRNNKNWPSRGIWSENIISNHTKTNESANLTTNVDNTSL